MTLFPIQCAVNDIILACYLKSPNLNKNGQAVFILQVRYNFHELCNETLCLNESSSIRHNFSLNYIRVKINYLVFMNLAIGYSMAIRILCHIIYQWVILNTT